jgi:mxaJ protein
VYGDYATNSPPSRIIDAVARGDIDVAIAWGPMAGYWARQAPAALTLTPVTPEIEVPFLPNVFDISVGVRRRDSTRRTELEAILIRRRGDIERILDSYGVPRLPVSMGAGGSP